MDIKAKTRRVSLGIAIVFTSILFVAAVLYGLINTDASRVYLSKALSGMLSKGPDMRVEVGVLKGTLPFDIRLDELTVSDGKGRWLKIESAWLKWSLRPLLQGRIHVRDLGARRIRLERWPAVSGEGGQQHALWPLPIPPLALDQCLIERIEVSEAINGVSATFRMAADIKSESEERGPALMGRLRLERTDGPKALAAVTWSLTGERPVLELKAEIEEPEEGLIKGLLGLKETGSVSIVLKGKGPADAWEGHLSARAEKLGRFESSVVSAGQKDSLRLKTKGYLQAVSAIMPEPLSVLIGESECPVSMDIQYKGPGEVILHRAEMETKKNSLRLAGKMDLATSRLIGEFDFHAADMFPLEALIGQKLGGRLDLRGQFEGTYQQPKVHFSLSISDPAYQSFQAEKTESEWQLEALGQMRGHALPDFKVIGQGRVEGLSHQGMTVLLPEPALQWSLISQVSAKGALRIDALEISGKNTSMGFSGRIDPPSPNIMGDIRLDIRDLDTWSHFLGRTFPGAISIQAKVNADGRTRNIAARLKGRVKGLRSGQRTLDSLVGSEIQWSCEATMAGANNLTMRDIQVHSEAARISGDGALNIQNKTMRYRGDLEIHDLVPLSPALRRPVAGPMRANIEVEGTLSSPTIRCNATSGQIRVNGLQFDEVKTRLVLHDPVRRPRGHVRLEVQNRADHFQAEADFAVQGQEVDLEDLRMDTPGDGDVRGNLRINLSRDTATGSIRGRSMSLSWLSPFLGEEISGQLSFTGDLKEGIKGQEIQIRLEGEKLHSRFGNINRAKMQAHLVDLFRQPAGSTRLEIHDFKKESLIVEKMSLDAKGGPAKVMLSGRARGRYKEAFDIQTRGSVVPLSDVRRFFIERLDGRFGTLPVALADPVDLWQQQGHFELKDVAFRVGSGHLRTSVKTDPEGLSIIIKLEDLPVEAFQWVGLPNISGRASGDIRMAGPYSAPQAEAAIRVRDMRFNGDSKMPLPSGLMKTRLVLRKGHLNAELSFEGLTEKPLTARFETPFHFSLLPLSWSVPKDAELDGGISGRINLARIPSLFALDNQLMDGRFSAELKVSGRLEAPQVEGDIRIVDGVYENLHMGILLRDIQMIARLTGDQLNMKKAQADDDGGGTISVTGRAQILPDFPFHLDLILKDLHAVRRDDLTISTSGYINLEGSLKQGMLSGELDVGPAEFRIPDRLPPEIVDLDVTEINRPAQVLSPQKEKRQPSIPGNLAMDLGLVVPGRVFIRGRGLDTEWVGNLRVKGRVSEPLLTGTMAVRRGRYDFAGKRFVLKTGILSFDGAFPPSPHIEVVAEHERSDIIARISVSGIPTSLKMTLDSTPPLPSDEILSRILFGRTVSQISPVQALQLASAVNALAGGSSVFDVIDRTRQFLGVDKLDIRSSEDGKEGAAVSMGKYLRDDVYVEMEQGMEPDSGKVSVEVGLTPHITIETEAGADAQGGVGFNWKWDY